MDRYSNIEILKNTSYNNNVTIGTKYYATNLYPEVPLKESAISNPNEVDFGSLSIKPGTQLRIPTEIFEILDQYNELNQND